MRRKALTRRHRGDRSDDLGRCSAGDDGEGQPTLHSDLDWWPHEPVCGVQFPEPGGDRVLAGEICGPRGLRAV